LSDDPRYVIRAVVRAPHGIAGMVRASLNTDFPERLTEARRVCLRWPDGRLEERGLRSAAPYKNGLLLKFEGIDDRDAAETLREVELVAPFEELPKLPEGEYYWHQLRGLRVVTTEGEEVGVIADILRTGSNDVYVTEKLVRGRRREGPLIPAIPDVVERVDPEEGVMVIRPLPGLLD
jgi:16S rRNA processing protein RimM